MNFYYRESDSTKLALNIDSVFTLHAQSLRFMQAYTKIPYPFKKFDFIAIPDFPYGGMEHVGAIDYKESSLFLEKIATPSEKEGRLKVIAHETAHMWFGNLVTMKWFDDVWMKEVFANFMADKVYQELNPKEDDSFQFLLTHHAAAYSVDRTKGTNPIRQSLSNLNKAGSLYGSIIYSKSPIVIRQLEKMIGKEALQKGMQSYLRKFAFQNADWNDLIRILDELSPADLSDWNNQWVNKTGRPVLDYSLETKNGLIEKWTLHQKPENHNEGIWKQVFSVALVYKDSVKMLPVNMESQAVELNHAKGLPMPKYFVFNAKGDGYGLFPIDTAMLSHLSKQKNEVIRASGYINLYENLLDGKGIKPVDFLQLIAKNMTEEGNIKILERIASQFRSVYWQFISPKQRLDVSALLENSLWEAIEKTTHKTKKRILFQTFNSIALRADSQEKLYTIWQNQKAPNGIELTEDDYTNLAASLSIKKHADADKIGMQQLARIKNEDRKKRFAFCMPALSNDVKIRDAFFDSLADKSIRRNEDWVQMGLGYLNHPLREDESKKYVPKVLEMLKEVQETGDIFFPSAWLRSTLSSFQSKETAQMVHDFLAKNPQYDPNLKGKILQESDKLFRAVQIIR